MAIEIVDLPINSMVIFHRFLHSYVNVYQRVPLNPYENGLMTISQDCSKSAHKTVENNIWTHLGHRTCCWNHFNPRAFVKWGFQCCPTSGQKPVLKFLLWWIFVVLKIYIYYKLYIYIRDFPWRNPPIHGSNPCLLILRYPNRRLGELSLHLLQLQLRLANTLRLGNRQKLAASDLLLMDMNTKQYRIQQYTTYVICQPYFKYGIMEYCWCWNI